MPKKYAVTELQTPYHGDAFIGRTVPCVFVLVVFLVSDKTSMCDEESCVLVFVVNPSRGGSRRWSIARQGGGKLRYSLLIFVTWEGFLLPDFGALF